MRRTLPAMLVAALAVTGLAAAQDPALEESDLDTAAPPGDEAYLDEGPAAPGDPTLEEGDLDTSVPPGDEAYLDEDFVGPPEPASRATPGAPASLVLAGLGAAVLLARRKR